MPAEHSFHFSCLPVLYMLLAKKNTVLLKPKKNYDLISFAGHKHWKCENLGDDIRNHIIDAMHE